MSAYRFYHPIEVRYGDLDPQGHVNNARYLSYLEQVRIAYLRHLGLLDVRSWLEIGIILADVHMAFKAPILFGQPIRVGMRTVCLGNKSLTVENTIEDAGTRQEMAAATVVLVTYDYHTGESIPIPAAWREAISAFEAFAEAGG